MVLHFTLIFSFYLFHGTSSLIWLYVLGSTNRWVNNTVLSAYTTISVALTHRNTRPFNWRSNLMSQSPNPTPLSLNYMRPVKGNVVKYFLFYLQENAEIESCWLYMFYVHRPFLTLSQTNPCFYVSEVQVFWKHCGKRRNCSWRAISSFPTVFSTLLDMKIDIVVCKLFQFGSPTYVVWERIKKVLSLVLQIFLN